MLCPLHPKLDKKTTRKEHDAPNWVPEQPQQVSVYWYEAQ